MAQKPLRPCRHPGCSVLVSEGYCTAHKPKDSARRSEDSKAWHWMYSTDEWTKDLRNLRSFCVSRFAGSAQSGIRQ